MAPMVLQIPLGNLFTSCKSDTIELLHVIEEIAKRANAERLANNMRVQAYIHETSAVCTLGIEPIELLFEHFESTVNVHALPHEDREVVSASPASTTGRRRS